MLFVNPPWSLYRFVEEPAVYHTQDRRQSPVPFVRMSGMIQGKSPMRVEEVTQPQSRFGFVWRGLRRPSDRERGIAGSELIVLDLKTNDVLGVRRNYVLTGFTRNASEGIWWLNAIDCPNLPKSGKGDLLGSQLYGFISKVGKPSAFDNGSTHARPN